MTFLARLAAQIGGRGRDASSSEPPAKRFD
jgi:hypothetical protein